MQLLSMYIHASNICETVDSPIGTADVVGVAGCPNPTINEKKFSELIRISETVRVLNI